jgi:acylphosphatase
VSARRAVLTGRVQGVGFRFFAERTARSLGVKGWVRNLSDGSVETLVEGPEEALQEYLNRLREGPGGARVLSVSVEEVAPQDLTRFEITR